MEQCLLIKGGVKMQMHTERGLIKVVCEFPTDEEAKEAGFYYSFTSKELDAEVYSKTLDDRGLYHEFALVRR